METRARGRTLSVDERPTVVAKKPLGEKKLATIAEEPASAGVPARTMATAGVKSAGAATKPATSTGVSTGEVRRMLADAKADNEMTIGIVKRLEEQIQMLRLQIEASNEQLKEARKEAKEAREEARMREAEYREETRQREAEHREELRKEKELFNALLAQTLGGTGAARPESQQELQREQEMIRRLESQQRQEQRQQLEEQQRQRWRKQQPQQQQQQRPPVQEWPTVQQSGRVQRRGAVKSTPPAVLNEPGEWVEVVSGNRRNNKRNGANRPRQPAQQQPVHRQYQQWAHQRAGQQQQRLEIHQQEKRRPRRKRPDEIIVVPAPGVSYKDMYVKLRSSPRIADFQRQIGVGRRTPKDHLLLPLSRDVDSAALRDIIEEVIGDSGSVTVKTEMAEVVMTGIDNMIDEEAIKKALRTSLGKQSLVANVNLWERRDMTKRARVRLPRAEAELVKDRRLELGYTYCVVHEAPKVSGHLTRCFRCLERGHIAATCTGEDRSKRCLRCGDHTHKASVCTNVIKCMLCGGAHRIGAAACGGQPSD
uniref:CCHC-type domain-containing protein n=2 Tax=Cellia TaxID=44534 RepID=A0A182NVP3_9DIPT